MALSKKVSKEAFDKLPDVIKSEYIEDGEGYRLDIDGEEDTGRLKRAKDRESQLRKEAEQALREAQEQLDALGTDDARKRGDIDLLTKNYDSKLEAKDKEIADLTAKHDDMIKKTEDEKKASNTNAVATALASKLNPKSSKVLMPHVKARLQTIIEDGETKTLVLDSKGNPSNMTTDDLYKEFVADDDFSGIITGSQASGSAGTTNNQGRASDFSGEEADFSKMNPQELAEKLKKGSDQ